MDNEQSPKGAFDEIAVNVIAPIMNKIYEVAFDCLETYHHDSETPIIVPFAVKANVIEELEEVLKHCQQKESFYHSASVIGYALGKDGMKPARQYGSMARVCKALLDLLEAKNDQIKEELEYAKNGQARERMASVLGF